MDVFSSLSELTLLRRRMISCVVHKLPIEVTGRVGFIKSLDMERVVEADYDRWVSSAGLCHSLIKRLCGAAEVGMETLYGDGLLT